jgi:alginate O-acetyltransferase complex protein AlgI
MLFNSIPFLLFFPIVTILYFLLPHKFRWLLLLIASCFFYMFFKAVYILILFFTIVIDYYAGILIEQELNSKKRKRYLIMSLIANIGVLAVFKYYNFLNTNIEGLINILGYKNPIPYLQILLPIGLSFHTFQAMSYTLEVYGGKQKAEHHFGIYALYVMYYPQLVAGPIERPQNMLHQFYIKQHFNIDRTIEGLKLIFWGLFKKIVIADRLALCVNEVYNNVHYYKGGPLLLAIFFFTFQIYCDFSGYSDIARGCSRVMGIELMKNFNAPYLARSIKEFWSRWHISLSTWFRDYLYIPLGGNKAGKQKLFINILIVFLISGLWHGASWTFIIWGFIHAVFNILGIAGKSTLSALGKHNKFLQHAASFLSWAATFSIVTVAWIFFRANTLDDAFYVLRHALEIDFHHFISIPIFSYFFYISSFILIFILFGIEWINERTVLNTLLLKNKTLTFLFFSILFISIYILGIFEKQSFIYFQF